MTLKPDKSSPGKQVIPFRQRGETKGSVGESLREKYDKVKNEPIPENLQSLIDALRKAEQEGQADEE